MTILAAIINGPEMTGVSCSKWKMKPSAMWASSSGRSPLKGSPLRVGGVGGVATSPRWQRRGLAQQLMEKAAAFMRADMGVEFGLLVCGDHMVPYYSRLGWQVVPGPLLVEQPQGKIIFPTTTMVLPLTGKPWPAGTIDLCGLPW